MMKRIVTRSPSSSSKNIHAALLAKATIVNLTTASQRLSNELGLKSCKPARQLRQATATNFNCLDFMKKYDDLTANHLEKVLLSDE